MSKQCDIALMGARETVLRNLHEFVYRDPAASWEDVRRVGFWNPARAAGLSEGDTIDLHIDVWEDGLPLFARLVVVDVPNDKALDITVAKVGEPVRAETIAEAPAAPVKKPRKAA